MAVLQSTFNDDPPYGYPGMEADGELSNILSRVLEGSTACAFGRPAYQGVADRGVTLTVSADLVGFAIAHKGNVVTADRAADTYAAGDVLPVKERGKIWVTSTTAATKGQPVYVTAAGAITNVSTGNTAATGWEFDDTIAAAGIIRIVRR
ncbi:structural cement protein Gp24 [Sphingomonas koreensis]